MLNQSNVPTIARLARPIAWLAAFSVAAGGVALTASWSELSASSPAVAANNAAYAAHNLHVRAQLTPAGPIIMNTSSFEIKFTATDATTGQPVEDVPINWVLTGQGIPGSVTTLKTNNLGVARTSVGTTGVPGFAYVTASYGAPGSGIADAPVLNDPTDVNSGPVRLEMEYIAAGGSGTASASASATPSGGPSASVSVSPSQGGSVTPSGGASASGSANPSQSAGGSGAPTGGSSSGSAQPTGGSSSGSLAPTGGQSVSGQPSQTGAISGGPAGSNSTAPGQNGGSSSIDGTNPGEKFPARGVAKVKAAQPIVTIVKGKRIRIPAFGYTVKGQAVKLKWRSSKVKVAKVSPGGTIRARKVGRTIITATAPNGLSTKIKVVVVKRSSKAKVKRITVKGLPKKLQLGQVAFANASFRSTAAIDTKVVYRSLNPQIVAVDKAGRVLAKRVGKARLIIRAGNKRVKKLVTVIVSD
ncbi:MAG: hypothetical protein LBG70_03905 [Bifidobacteriaceae bacterium]|nr:hypothetical protein [Bifidobacteriaceae bacterium]